MIVKEIENISTTLICHLINIRYKLIFIKYQQLGVPGTSLEICPELHLQQLR